MKNYKTIKSVIRIVFFRSALSAGFFAYKSGENKRNIYRHRNEYHQIIRPLFDRKIIENQYVDEILDKYPPTKISHHDNYLTLQYFKNNEEPEDCCVSYSYYVHIIARDNRLVKAFAAEGFFAETDYVFFDVLNDSSEDDYWESRMNNAVTINSER